MRFFGGFGESGSGAAMIHPTDIGGGRPAYSPQNYLFVATFGPTVQDPPRPLVSYPPSSSACPSRIFFVLSTHTPDTAISPPWGRGDYRDFPSASFFRFSSSASSASFFFFSSSSSSSFFVPHS